MNILQEKKNHILSMIIILSWRRIIKGDYVIKHESLNLKMVIIPIIIMLMYLSVIMVNLLILIVMRLLRIL